MAELILAVGLITVAILFLVGLSTATLRASDKSSKLYPGYQVARKELDRVCSSAAGDPNFWLQDYLATPWESGSIRVGTTEFNFEIFARTLLDESTSAPLGTSTSANNRVKKVDIVVSWSGGERQGQGQLRVRASQLVNEEAP